jgi:hypothetical protein
VQWAKSGFIFPFLVFAMGIFIIEAKEKMLRINQQEGAPTYNSMLAIAAGSVLIWKFVFLL